MQHGQTAVGSVKLRFLTYGVDYHERMLGYVHPMVVQRG